MAEEVMEVDPDVIMIVEDEKCQEDLGNTSVKSDSSEAGSQNESNMDESGNKMDTSLDSQSKPLPPSTPTTTPRRKETKAEKEARRLAREKEREEKRIKAEKEKEEKRLKAEKEKQERDEKKKQIEREKEERKKQMEAERQLKREKEAADKEAKRIKLEEEKMERVKKKEEEKQRKEEERLKKLEEKRLAEEEKQKKLEEEKQKHERSQQKILQFFRKSSDFNKSSSENNVTSVDEPPTPSRFLPFVLQPFQSLAEIVPKRVKDRFRPVTLDDAMISQDVPKENLYSGKGKKPGGRRISQASKNVSDNENDSGYSNGQSSQSDDEIQIIKEDGEGKRKCFRYKAKLFQFHEDHRPAYFGTYRKKSKEVSGRRPFGLDSTFLNYNVDSEAEWEEEEEGESLNGSDPESGDEKEDYEMDDMFVKHGHLSDDEQSNDDEDKVKVGPLTKEEMIMMKKPLKKLKPVIIGCCWRDSANQDDPSLFLLEEYKAIYFSQL